MPFFDGPRGNLTLSHSPSHPRSTLARMIAMSIPTLVGTIGVVLTLPFAVALLFTPTTRPPSRRKGLFSLAIFATALVYAVLLGGKNSDAPTWVKFAAAALVMVSTATNWRGSSESGTHSPRPRVKRPRVKRSPLKALEARLSKYPQTTVLVLSILAIVASILF